ncbi:uncharacterized protein LOC135118784 [Helicoverpa armigera]|uniref:uncharacterized protein LOC135118784 n=1 Tax=Helicoverpa armigera TaxID=29058 RepID=UPI003082E211
MFDAYKNIVDVYKTIQDLFNLTSIVQSVGTQLWIIKNTFLITCLCVQCEGFYTAMKDVLSMCKLIKKSGDSTESRKQFCKKIMLINKRFRKMTACGLFYVDASLPMSLMGVSGQYAVVLLQFNFL